VIGVTKLLFASFQIEDIRIYSVRPFVGSFVCMYETTCTSFNGLLWNLILIVTQKLINDPQIILWAFIFELNQSTVNTCFSKVQVTEFSYRRWSLRKME